MNAEPVFDCVWHWRCRLPERKGAPCRVVRKLRADTIEVAFADGVTVVTSSHAIRRRQAR